MACVCLLSSAEDYELYDINWSIASLSGGDYSSVIHMPDYDQVYGVPGNQEIIRCRSTDGECEVMKTIEIYSPSQENEDIETVIRIEKGVKIRFLED